MLENNSVAIEVFEGLSLSVPVRIVRGDFNKPSTKHAGASLLPFVLVRKVKNKKMILGGSSADLVLSLRSKLEVIRVLWMSEDDAIESVMIGKLGKNFEAKSFHVHLGNFG
jgi:hypothetical protein